MKPMGLSLILFYSALSGISFAFAYRMSGGTQGGGISFMIFDYFSKNIDGTAQVYIILVSSVLTLVFIYRLAKFFQQVLKNRLTGIVIAILGFIGSLLILFAPQDNSHVLVIGIGTWIVAAVLVIFYRKKLKNNRNS